MELILLIGLPGSGKSTFFRSRFAATHDHVSKDNFRNASRPQQRQERLIREALEAGRSVVVDNTNASLAERAPSIAAGRAAGARVIGYYFASNTSDCMARNSLREGKARVPDIAIVITERRLQVPTLTEGFDELNQVSLGEMGQFYFAPWQEEAE